MSSLEAAAAVATAVVTAAAAPEAQWPLDGMTDERPSGTPKRLAHEVAEPRTMHKKRALHDD